MDSRRSGAPSNYFGETDPIKLEALAGELATIRLGELESAAPLTSFTTKDLVHVHRYLLQDIYPWAGELRNEEVSAMGIAMCRATFVPEMLDNVMRSIAEAPPSTTNLSDAVITVAQHWGELTIVHPFRDGNSRTQRFFFDQMLRHSGWAIDWSRVYADEVHAARYIAAATLDSRFLADALQPGVFQAHSVPKGTLQQTQGTRLAKNAAQIYHQMRRFRVEHPGKSFHNSEIGKPPADG